MFLVVALALYFIGGSAQIRYTCRRESANSLLKSEAFSARLTLIRPLTRGEIAWWYTILNPSFCFFACSRHRSEHVFGRLRLSHEFIAN